MSDAATSAIEPWVSDEIRRRQLADHEMALHQARIHAAHLHQIEGAQTLQSAPAQGVAGGHHTLTARHVDVDV